MENKLLIAKTAPHTKTTLNVKQIITHIFFSLMPTVVVAINYFGVSALNVIIVCMCSAFLFEVLINIILKSEKQIASVTSLLMGLLVALVLPSSTPIWLCVLASGICVVVVLGMVNKLGVIKINAVALTLLILMLFFSNDLNTAIYVDFAMLNQIGFQGLLIGLKAGCIGEVCAIALILGMLYLCVFKIIDWKMPVFCLLFTFILFLCFNNFSFVISLKQMLSGSVIFVCTYLACDCSSCPQNSFAKIIYCFILSLLVVLLRMFCVYNNILVLGVVLANLFTPFLDDFAIYLKYKHNLLK